MRTHPTYRGRGWAPGAMAPAHGPYPGHMPPVHHPHYHSFCASCCHPMHSCVCGIRECRKEAKELLVAPEGGKREVAIRRLAALFKAVEFEEVRAKEAEEGGDEEATIATPQPAVLATRFVEPVEARGGGQGRAYIGGGCCVHLSVEFTAQSKASTVAVVVVDSENTSLGWVKQAAEPGYHIKECIITTKPGAQLLVVVADAIARVRWCEVFAC